MITYNKHASYKEIRKMVEEAYKDDLGSSATIYDCWDSVHEALSQIEYCDRFIEEFQKISGIEKMLYGSFINHRINMCKNVRDAANLQIVTLLNEAGY